MTLTVKLQHLHLATGARALFITINGRQALNEGPRRVGCCVYCKGRCLASTPNCERRVFVDRNTAGLR